MTETVVIGDTKVVIDPELKGYAGDLSKDEKKDLEGMLVRDGCRDSVRAGYINGVLTLVDGHNRAEICERLGLPLPEKIEIIKDVPTIDKAKLWMLKNQDGRRNKTDEQRKYNIGERLRLELKTGRGGGDRRSEEADQ